MIYGSSLVPVPPANSVAALPDQKYVSDSALVWITVGYSPSPAGVQAENQARFKLATAAEPFISSLVRMKILPVKSRVPSVPPIAYFNEPVSV